MGVRAAIAGVAMALPDRLVSNEQIAGTWTWTPTGSSSAPGPFLSRFLDVSDRDTAPLFADGAGAAVVSATDSPIGRIGPIVLRSDPSGSQLIRLSRGDHIRMNGHESFRAAVSAISEVTLEALAASDVRLEDIDLFVHHEANSRIIRAVGQRLELPPDRVVDYVGRFANASTATLPIALSVAQSQGRLEPGAQVLLAAFGGCLTWGAAVAEWCAPAGRCAIAGTLSRA
jgi:3-oxoacyl-[acyl-carrier-protein] synthase-3